MIQDFAVLRFRSSAPATIFSIRSGRASSADPNFGLAQSACPSIPCSKNASSPSLGEEAFFEHDFHPDCGTLDGSFSAVSTPPIAGVGAFPHFQKHTKLSS